MAKFQALPWLVGLWKRLPPASTWATDLSGKTVLITGANVGLGLETAKHLARLRPEKLILACRDLQKAEAAKALIVQECGVEEGTVLCWELDQAKFESVRAFVGRFEREGGGRLDLLIANAGISTAKYAKTSDGWEQTLQVNHLSTSLLVLLLLPHLLAAPLSPPTPRVVLLTSEMHLQIADIREPAEGTILEALNGEESIYQAIEMLAMQSFLRYGVSKLLNLAFARALGAHLPSTTPLTVNAVNPSSTQSSLQRELGTCGPWLLQKMFFRRTEMGSRTIVHAALGMDAQGVQGAYLNDCAVAECSDFLLSEKGVKVQEQLWNETIDVLRKFDPKVLQIVKGYLS
ncbi:NAD(P)-binding protein [Calocera viscosa TUFC12733]|uniref:NAD(P)-binding protein n=1 Tax=Calocera viscosa (strain TUFC12733) TaxID=1330018 RepID=A0A167PSN9_CALVF|nr:NAD(P)-binding protein [Calocera viscosa TUFC12733]